MPIHTMRAVRLHEHGGPEVLRYDEVPIPEPGPGEVLVRVHAAGVNPPDWYLRGGLTRMPGETASTVRLPVIPGTDVSGVVEAVAADVDGFAIGDEVFGLLRFPSFDGSAYAEYVAAPATDLARKPAGIDHVQAAGAPIGRADGMAVPDRGRTRSSLAVPEGAASPDGARRRHDGARQRCRGRRGAFRATAGEVEGRTCHSGGIGRT